LRSPSHIVSGPTLHFSTFYLWLLAWFAWQTHIAIRIRQVRSQSHRNCHDGLGAKLLE
jgi:hypothetical protein